MDLLASLHIDDELAEQQTRTSHLQQEELDHDVCLGFNACCSCACKLASEQVVTCRACRRVKYCSPECRSLDAAAPKEEETALGHSSVICSLLRLCKADEDAEQGTKCDQDAMNRVESERESYPATLCNILLDAPCFQETLTNNQKDEFVIHVVGASQDAELWGLQDQVWDAYTEALSQVAERFRIQVIRLCFVGPDCPNLLKEQNFSYKEHDSYTLVAETRNGLYEEASIKKPNVAVFFNPGFTCSDNDWSSTLAKISKNDSTPFLVATSTEMEGIADCQYLWQHSYISSLPPVVAEVLDEDSANNNLFFFGENPYAGSRVRQSATMANDVYVRNRWMFGGNFGSTDTAGVVTSQVTENTKKRKRRAMPHSNTKQKNPALI